MRGPVQLLAFAISAATVTACIGQIGGTDDGSFNGAGSGSGADGTTSTSSTTGPKGPCTSVTPARRVWMLSRMEYDNTVAAVLGDTSNQAQTTFPQENRTNTFSSNATAEVVSTAALNSIMAAAETIGANQAAAQTGKLGCSPSDSPTADSMDSCIGDYIKTVGAKFYRRPLVDSEVADMYSVYLTGHDNPYPNVDAATSGVRLLITTFLASPQFLYRTELGEVNDTAPVATMTQYEIATAIAYIATAGPPDDALVSAAAAGTLTSPDALSAQFDRLIRTPAGHKRVQQFILEWLGGDNIASLGRAGQELTPDVSGAMLTESQTFIDNVVYGGAGTLNELLTAKYTYVNPPLATFYGIAPADQSSNFGKVSATGQSKVGILSQGSFVASASSSGVPILHRGELVRSKLFCQTLPSVASLGLPNFTPPPLGTPGAGQTTRDLLTQTIQPGTACATCHQYFMPIGFAFDNFDTVGKYRAQENGKNLDTSGYIAESASIDPKTGLIADPLHSTQVQFSDFASFADTIAKDPEVQECFAEKLYTFASGRADVANNECEMGQVQTDFMSSGTNILTAFAKYVQSPSFTRRAR